MIGGIVNRRLRAAPHRLTRPGPARPVGARRHSAALPHRSGDRHHPAALRRGASAAVAATESSPSPPAMVSASGSTIRPPCPCFSARRSPPRPHHAHLRPAYLADLVGSALIIGAIRGRAGPHQDRSRTRHRARGIRERPPAATRRDGRRCRSRNRSSAPAAAWLCIGTHCLPGLSCPSGDSRARVP